MTKEGGFSNWKFVSGVVILFALVISYFIKINVESGANFSTTQPLLAKLIFESPIVLGVYVLIAVWLILSGLGRKR